MTLQLFNGKRLYSTGDVCYDIRIKGGGRRILDHVDGWVKPGTLTAMVGVSGAGKRLFSTFLPLALPIALV